MKKYKIGFTDGVYDLFHVGHLNMIRTAKEYCDYLIVGVHSDEIVNDYKHHYPVINENDRKEIVESIKYVDKCVEELNRKIDVKFVKDAIIKHYSDRVEIVINCVSVIDDDDLPF